MHLDKFKKRFNEIEVEFESWEITRKNEVRKCETERELVEEKLKLKEDIIRRIEEQRQAWIKRYDEEHESSLYTLCQLNNLKVEIEDLKAEKAKLESDIKEIDKINKKNAENLEKRADENEELTKINEKLRVQLEGAKDALYNIEIHHKDYITKLKKDHRKEMANVDGVYNRAGMEYEDLFVKTCKYYNDSIDSMVAIKNLKEQLKSQKDQTRRQKDILAEQNSKLELSK